jgi:hypothetical protein
LRVSGPESGKECNKINVVDPMRRILLGGINSFIHSFIHSLVQEDDAGEKSVGEGHQVEWMPASGFEVS